MARRYLSEMCQVLRSKNAGPFRITLDILFPNHEDYRTIVDRKLLTKDVIANAYGIPGKEVVNFETFDNVSAIKATIKRKISCGSPGDSDCYGMNQEAPLLQLSFPEELFKDFIHH